jgi:hypothetical protein
VEFVLAKVQDIVVVYVKNTGYIFGYATDWTVKGCAVPLVTVCA